MLPRAGASARGERRQAGPPPCNAPGPGYETKPAAHQHPVSTAGRRGPPGLTAPRGAGRRARCALPRAKGSRTWAHQATGGVQGTREGSWLRAWGGGQASRVETQRSCLLLENWGVHSAPTVQVRSGYRRWGACWLGVSMPIRTCALLCPLGRGAPRPWAVGKSARLRPGLRGPGTLCHLPVPVPPGPAPAPRWYLSL